MVAVTMPQDVTYEWCVVCKSFPDEPHRLMDSEEEALDWIAEDGLEKVFWVARRAVSRWERV